jgi:hypothetical protein
MIFFETAVASGQREKQNNSRRKEKKKKKRGRNMGVGLPERSRLWSITTIII